MHGRGFAKDHKGRGSQSFADLVPKYIFRPRQNSSCPTAKRWIGKGVHMAAGEIKVAGKAYPVTYGFRVFRRILPDRAEAIRRQDGNCCL